MSRAISLFFLLPLLSSCGAAGTYRTAVNSFLDAAPCCVSMAEFKYDRLPSDEPVTFRLDEKSEAFVFHSGKSYFKAFQLPKKEVPYRIQVKSFALGATIDKAHIFYPQVALLDSGFDIVKQSDPKNLTPKKTVSKEAPRDLMVGLKLEGTVLVDIPDARYLVVYTTKKLMGTSTTEYHTKRKRSNIIYSGIPAADLTFMVLGILTTGGALVYEEPVNIPHSSFGWISIRVAQ